MLALPLTFLLTLLSTTLASPAIVDKRQVKILAGAPVSDITVDAGSLVSCQSTTISWTNGVAPFTLTIATGGLYLPTTYLSTIPSLTSSSYDWVVTEPQGTGMYFSVTDSTNSTGYVQNVYVAASLTGDTSCLASGASSSSTPASSSDIPLGGATSSSAAAAPSPISSSSSAGSASASASATSSYVSTVGDVSSSNTPPTTLVTVTDTSSISIPSAGLVTSSTGGGGTITRTSTSVGAQATLQSATSGASRELTVGGALGSAGGLLLAVGLGFVCLL